MGNNKLSIFITFTISQMSKYNSDPRAGHMKVAKMVVRYLKGLIHLEWVYRSSQNEFSISCSLFSLVRYRDSVIA